MMKNLGKNKKMFYGILIVGMLAIIGLGSVASFWSTYAVTNDWTIEAVIDTFSVAGWDAMIEDGPGTIVSDGEDPGYIEVEPDGSFPNVLGPGETLLRTDSGYPSVIGESSYLDDLQSVELSAASGFKKIQYTFTAVLKLQTHTTELDTLDDTVSPSIDGTYIFDAGDGNTYSLNEYAELQPMIGSSGDENNFKIVYKFYLIPANEDVTSTCVISDVDVASRFDGMMFFNNELHTLNDFAGDLDTIRAYGDLDVVASPPGDGNFVKVTMTGDFGSGAQLNHDGGLDIYEAYVEVPIEFTVVQTINEYDNARFGIFYPLSLLPKSFALEEFTTENIVALILVVTLVIGLPALVMYLVSRTPKK
jgi:hypothetical protein